MCWQRADYEGDGKIFGFHSISVKGFYTVSHYGRYFMGLYKSPIQQVLNKCLLGAKIRKAARREMEPIL